MPPEESETVGQEVDVNKMFGSYQRQLAELHSQLALKDALLEQAHEEHAKTASLLSDAQAMLNKLQPKDRTKVKHEGRTTKSSKKGKNRAE